ncbi:MAG TPA: hypothetical protein VIC51_12410 [Psychromonas sp.]
MNNTVQLKKLQTLLNKFSAEADAIRIEISEKQKAYNQKVKEVNILKDQINKYKHSGEPIVSEHALLRYMERVLGIDLDEYRKKILSDNVLKQVNTLGGNGTFANDGFQVVMKDNVVVTIK